MEELKIKNPVIIIGCPRSGTSLLFTILSSSKHLWSLYQESNDIWEKFYRFSNKEFKNEVLTNKDLNSESKKFLLNEFHKYSFNNYCVGALLRKYASKHSSLSFPVTTLNLLYKKLLLNEYRIVEKTPKNCFRISFIDRLFNNCKFIFLKRDGRANINSLIEGWESNGKYIRASNLPLTLSIKGYYGQDWNFVMPPGWENYINKPLEEVCAFQWISSNKFAIDGLKDIAAERKLTISYEDLTENTYEVTKEICDFVDIPFSGNLRNLSYKPPQVNYITKPKKDKWKENLELIENIYPLIEPMMKELGYSM